MNDTGESLQSEELQGATGRRGGKKRLAGDEEVSMSRESGKKALRKALVLAKKMIPTRNYHLSGHASLSIT